MRSSHHTLSFIVPFLNEASNLPRLLSALDQFARTAAQARNLEVDVIFVDDGSSDGGRDVITACVCTNLIRPKVRLVRLSRNFGKEIALSVGLKAAASDAGRGSCSPIGSLSTGPRSRYGGPRAAHGP